ncbi:MAG: preprotein translocase subunit SecE [bacterium]|nr:preprotein translocase subunit SecE [bacterium]
MASIAENWRNFKTFLVETKAEMNKVTFPARQEVITTTSVVVVASVIFALFLWFSDVVILEVYQGILRLIGRA